MAHWTYRSIVQGRSMITLKGQHINLRALEIEDVNTLYVLENEESIWELSHTITPYSRYILRQYIENSYKDIFEAKQLRLVIERKNEQFLGLIDLFDFDPKNHRAGLGILIYKEEDRKKGFAKEAITMLLNYAKEKIQLHQVYINISSNNVASLNLFRNIGFKTIGIKKDWNYDGNAYRHEILLQYIL